MLTEICGYLNNYFIDKAYIGAVSVQDGAVSCDGSEISMNEGQYFTLVREKYVLGVYQYGEEIPDRSFDGAVWLMDIPDDVMLVISDAEEWQNKYAKIVNSPFQSESKADFSYSLKSSFDNDGAMVWKQFVSRIDRYRKMR